jgi:hypothetical protein
MHSIGSAHAEVRSRRREISLVSTTDRILFIIVMLGPFHSYRSATIGSTLVALLAGIYAATSAIAQRITVASA